MRIILSFLLVIAFANGKAQVTDSTKSKPVDSKLEKVLVIINGVEQKKRGVKNIDSTLKPEQIESITVIKDKTAIDKYGEKGKDGVLIITLKKNATDPKLEEVKEDDKNIVFSKVEVEPAFKGGMKEWKGFLMKNLNPNVPIDNGAHEGTYTVVLEFIVDKDGTISDLKALTNHGYGMEEEAIRLMKLSPKWEPGIQNGRLIKSYKKQPITFVIEEEKQKEEVKDDEDIVFTKPEVEAAFPGGAESWKNFIVKNLDPETPLKHKAPLGTYTVIIQFIVDKSGKLSDYRALTNHGYGMEEECIRVLKRSPPWVPAMQNGYKVKAYRKQPMTFVYVKD